MSARDWMAVSTPRERVPKMLERAPTRSSLHAGAKRAALSRVLHRVARPEAAGLCVFDRHGDRDVIDTCR
jgi:hypothetical protein